MSHFVYPLVVSTLFGLNIAQMVGWRMPSCAAPLFAVTLGLWLASYWVPQRLLVYSNDQPAPTVLTTLMRRAGIAVALITLNSLVALVWSGLWQDFSFVEEMYVLTLIGAVIFHGLGGPFAHHVAYLQQTKQYNSNQLAAVLIAVTLMLFVLILFFLNLDFAIARDATTQGRDLLVLTTAMVGYGWTIYKVAHH